jgi:hypothetical protein
VQNVCDSRLFSSVSTQRFRLEVQNQNFQRFFPVFSFFFFFKMKLLKACRFPCAILVGILCLNFKFVHSDISDDECGIIKEGVAMTHALIITTENSLKPKLKNKTKINFKRSLLIIFDSTGSMNDDLVQLRSAAKEIVANFSAIEENPITNYVLSVFNDPGR